MPKPIKFTYEKKTPFRDAFLFIVVCEGKSREIEYFQFFDGMSSRLRIIPVTNDKGSAPSLLVGIATAIEEEYELKEGRDQLWFIIDTDRWREHLHNIRQECDKRKNWIVAQSNPCFEVWLYLHAKQQLPNFPDIDKCKEWKPYLPTIIKGGFDSNTHPVAIETAIENARKLYQATGYFPNPGCTQVWQLGEQLVPLIKKDLDILKQRFQYPIVIG